MQTQVKALESIRGRVDAAQRVQQAEATSSAAEKEIASLKATLKELQGQRNRAVKAAEAAKAATRTAKAEAQSLAGQREEQAAEEPAPGTSEAQQAASGGATLCLCSAPSSLGGSSPLSASPRRGLALRAAEEDEGQRRQRRGLWGLFGAVLGATGEGGI